MSSEPAESVLSEAGPVEASAPSSVRRGYRVGQVLAGKYRIERVIGEGAMGIVLAATHLGLDETVAIKFIRADLQAVGGTLSRFAREAKIAARIHSEHVVKVLDVGESDSIGPYIVMEYLEGQGLGSIGDARGRISVQRAVEYVMQACEALAAAHRIGVTHRDIKPDNLFLTTQGGLEVIKLLDFGISKATLTGRVFGDDLALTKTSYVIGTPLYMSPEQIRAARQVDHRTDIWSIGAVLYELVTGRTAFTAEGVTEICASIIESPTPQVSDLCPEAPAELQPLLDRCLQKKPEDRFQTVAELALALAPLAPDSARTYAERSSSILRGSSLDIDHHFNSAPQGEPALGEEQSAPPQLSLGSNTSAPYSLMKRMSDGKLTVFACVAAAGLALFAGFRHQDSPEVAPAARKLSSRPPSLPPLPSPPDMSPQPKLLIQSQLALTLEPLPALFGPPEAPERTQTPRPAQPPAAQPRALDHRGARKSPRKVSKSRQVILVGKPANPTAKPSRRIRLVSDTPETP